MLILVIALRCEAKPLIAHYGLKQRQHICGFSLFENRDWWLVIAGTGKVLSAAATAYCQGLLGDREDQVWLNVDVAGHPQRAVGKGVLAHQVTD